MNEMNPAAAKVLPMDADDGLHHIIIVGGGAGGLELATRLGDKLGRKGKAKISLVEKSRTHIWKPLLHEIAAGSMDVGRYELPYQAQGYWHGFQFRYGEMTGIDRKKRLVFLAATYDEEGREITPMRSFRYDTLVIAIGCVGNAFNTPGVKEHAIMLDTPEEAERFNRRLINACVRAFAQEGPVRPGQLDVAIIGAGATGTELAAELHQTARGLVAYGLDKINPEQDIKITLIEAADRIVPALPERISKGVAEILRGLQRATSRPARAWSRSPTRASSCRTATSSPPSSWCGRRASRAPTCSRTSTGSRSAETGQLVVTETLQTTRDPDVFAFGDCAYLVPKGADAPIPPRAQAAHQEASHLYVELQRRLKGEPLRPFHYRDFGSLVSLGEYSTVGSLMGFIVGRSFFIEGLFARLMYRSLYKMHEMALHGPGKVILDTLSRVITRSTEPVVKLH